MLLLIERPRCITQDSVRGRWLYRQQRTVPLESLRELIMKTKRFTQTLLLVGALGWGVYLQADSSEHSMIGCLKAGDAAGAFLLTDLGLADGPATVELTDSGAALAGHVGHKVEITGTTIAGTEANAHAMQVTAMKHLAASCP
jgi:hypothetical protein